MAHDAVSVFAEGSVDEQLHEIVNYIARSKQEQLQAQFIQPFQDALRASEAGTPLASDEKTQRKLFALAVQGTTELGPGSEREIEGFFNLLLSHIMTLFISLPDDLAQHIKHLVHVITSTTSQDHQSIRYRLLSTIFNTLPRESCLRIDVYETLLDLAKTNDQLSILQLSQAPMERWLNEWNVSPLRKSALLSKIAQVLLESGDEDQTYKYVLWHLQILPPSASESKQAAIETIVTALSTPSVLDFEPLLKSDAILALRDEPLFALLSLFLDGRVQDFLSWAKENATTMQTLKLEKSVLLRKLRTLALAQLGSTKVGQDIGYDEIASTLQIGDDDVDAAVIEVIHSGLVSGKLSQSERKFHVTRSTTRSFGRQDWELLESQLVAWKVGLEGVLEVLAASRKLSSKNLADTGESTRTTVPPV